MKHPELYRSPHQERKRLRRERLKQVILKEGSTLSNPQIQERFPWAGEGLIRAIRKEIGVLPPGSKYRRKKEEERQNNNRAARRLEDRDNA